MAQYSPTSSAIILSIDKGFSDGDQTTWPTDSRYGTVEPVVYLKKLAMQWIQSTGAQEIGKSYILDQLPEGYIVLDKPRPNQPNTRDKFLFGHPSGSGYTSPNKFWPHFQYLMSGGVTPCTCDFCTAKGKKPASSAHKPRGPMASSTPGPSGTSRGRGRPKVSENLVVDEEGTPDVFKLLAIKLKEQLTLDEPITEPDSIDWRAEHPDLIYYLKNISRQHSFIPRSGELVLFYFDRDGDLVYDEEAGRYGFYDEKKDKIVGYPLWRAGTVGETPEETVIMDDIVMNTPKRYAVNISGFRVETLPDPNGYDKSFSSQYKYVPMTQIRPFNYWQEFLDGVPQEEYHPSIENAMTVMSSFSMLDKYHFRGTWPNASILCRGVFLGAELLTVGDSIRLMPRSRPITPDSEVMDVLTIKTISLKLTDCVADPESELLSEKTAGRIYGQAYTLLPENAYRPPGSTEDPVPMTEAEVIEAFENVGMSGYGPWYRMHPATPGKGVIISFDQVVGRCYEPDAMQLIFERTDLGIDLEGVISCREFSSQKDERIPEGKDWFWGDCRTETLALESLNGQEVGKFEDIRNPRMWRANLKILDGTATKADIKAAMPSRGAGRPAAGPSGVGPDLSGFAAVGKTSSLVTAALGTTTTSAAVSSGEDGGVTAAASVSAENSGGQEELPGTLGGGERVRTPAEGVAFGDDEGETETESSEGEVEEVEGEPTVLLRGGTEESEGGDYAPDKGRQAKRRRQE